MPGELVSSFVNIFWKENKFSWFWLLREFSKNFLQRCPSPYCKTGICIHFVGKYLLTYWKQMEGTQAKESNHSQILLQRCKIFPPLMYAWQSCVTWSLGCQTFNLFQSPFDYFSLLEEKVYVNIYVAGQDLGIRINSVSLENHRKPLAYFVSLRKKWNPFIKSSYIID